MLLNLRFSVYANNNTYLLPTLYKVKIGALNHRETPVSTYGYYLCICLVA